MLDLHSGKLHREFHHGPDASQETPQIEVVKAEEPATEKKTGWFKREVEGDDEWNWINKRNKVNFFRQIVS